jgi:hypothetical protein
MMAAAILVFIVLITRSPALRILVKWRGPTHNGVASARITKRQW